LPEDRNVYHALQKADTIGTFQVESRAQMASLPRNHPEKFYDLVVQVAIIRPGPIVGQMMQPDMRRREKKEGISYPRPSLEPVLKRTMACRYFKSSYFVWR
jgi:error-prone DNA polymerase